MVYQQGYVPQRQLVGVGGVIALHVVVIWALVNGLGTQLFEVVAPPADVKLMQQTRQPEPVLPPPEQPQLKQLAPVVVPDVSLPPLAIERQTTVRATTDTAPVANDGPVAATGPVVLAPKVRASGCRKPDYPSISQRLGEQGTVLLALLVGTDGRVIDSRVEGSSGYSRLDRAAQEGLSRCRFEPGSVDGQLQAAWARMKYTFRQE